jgi:hypothetical protein
LFIFIRLTHRYNSYLGFGFGVHDHYDLLSQQTQRHPSLFAVVLAIILESESRTCEDQFGVSEIQAASLKGDKALGFVPSEAYNRIMHIIVCMSMRERTSA